MNGSGDMTAAFSEALSSAATGAVADSSPESTPTPESIPAETTPAAATAQPAEDTTASVTASPEEPKKGEPPAWRWQDILKNAREESAKEAEARARQEIEQQYAGLKDFQGLDADERAGLLVWNRALRGDPAALAQVEQVNPSLAAAISGRAVAPAGPVQPEPEPQPDAAIQLADGSTVPVFTHDGQKKREAWLLKQMEAQLSEKFAPLATTAEQLRAQQQRAEREQQTQQWAANVFKPLKAMPFFEELKPGISKALAELPANFQGDLAEVVQQAYTTQLQAKLDAITKNAVPTALASLQQRAVAGTGNPNAPGASGAPKFRPGTEGFAEALAHFDTPAR